LQRSRNIIPAGTRLNQGLNQAKTAVINVICHSNFEAYLTDNYRYRLNRIYFIGYINKYFSQLPEVRTTPEVNVQKFFVYIR
jgi:hypothetical protein